MKLSLAKSISVYGLAALFTMNYGCEFDSSGSDGFNLSQGAGLTIVFSGVYNPRRGATEVVPGRDIHRLVIAQTGNTVEVRDDQSSFYIGTVGAPAMIAPIDPLSGAMPPGAELAQAVVSWEGVNKRSNVDVQFAGVFHTVSITDIQGDTTTIANDVVQGVDNVDVTTFTGINSTNATSLNSLDITSVNAVVGPPDVTTTLVINSVDETVDLGQTDFSVTDTITNTDTTTAGTTATTDFLITEANTQIVLQGNWIENGGKTY